MNLKHLALQVLATKEETKHVVNKPEVTPKLLIEKKAEKFTPLRVAEQRLKSRIPANKTWLDENRVALRAAGFTNNDLYSSRPPTGISKLRLWGKEDLSVHLTGNTIFFSWESPTGRKITQTCRPEKRRELI